MAIAKRRNPIYRLSVYRIMKFILSVLLWFLLLSISWPLAVLAIVVIPVLWILSIPFKILGGVVEACINLVTAILLLPFKLLGIKV